MFYDQIKALTDKEDKILEDIDYLEDELKKNKAKLLTLRKAKKSLERLEDDSGEQLSFSDQPTPES